MGANIDKVLAANPGLLVGEIAERITAITAEAVTGSLINVYLSKAGDRYSKDTGGGPRKTRWSLAAGATPTIEAAAGAVVAAESPAKARKPRKKG